MQAILAKVLEAEFNIPVRIINGDTKARSAGSLNPLGQKTRNAILQDFPQQAGLRHRHPVSVLWPVLGSPLSRLIM